jgi:hypothetical protein
MRHEMARKAQKLPVASEQLEELTPAELTEVSGGCGYGHGYGYGGYGHGYGFRYGHSMPYGGVPFYGRPRYHQVYFPYA